MALFQKKRSLEDLERQQGEIAARIEAERKKATTEELTNNEIIVRPYETIRLHDLANMFPFNITPALIESKIQHALAAKHKMQDMQRNFIIFVLILMFGGVIAAYVAYKFFGDASIGPQEVKVTVDYAGNLIGASSTPTGNLTG